jgi:hypothetical protein
VRKQGVHARSNGFTSSTQQREQRYHEPKGTRTQQSIILSQAPRVGRPGPSVGPIYPNITHSVFVTA